jgi:hypothetical protein
MALWDDLRTLATAMDGEGLTAEAIVVRQAADQAELQTTYIARLDEELPEPPPDNDAHSTMTGLTDDDHTMYQLKSRVDQKGDLIVAASNNVSGRLAVGANGTVLTADSSTGAGMKWA